MMRFVDYTKERDASLPIPRIRWVQGICIAVYVVSLIGLGWIAQTGSPARTTSIAKLAMPSR
jgi:hypothetical protein